MVNRRSGGFQKAKIQPRMCAEPGAQRNGTDRAVYDCRSPGAIDSRSAADSSATASSQASRAAARLCSAMASIFLGVMLSDGDETRSFSASGLISSSR